MTEAKGKIYSLDQELVLERLGSDYGGWIIPQNHVASNSICYCAGVGEDITFDLELINRYGCKVHAFDPTPRARIHVEQHAGTNSLYQFHFEGLWKEDDEIEFFAPENPEHVSHSIDNLQGTGGGFRGKVRRLSHIMQALGHDHIDLLKIDIEGAEYPVVESIIEDNLEISVLCIEYHEMKSEPEAEERSLQRLRDFGYALAAKENQNVTLLRVKEPGSGHATT